MTSFTAMLVALTLWAQMPRADIEIVIPVPLPPVTVTTCNDIEDIVEKNFKEYQVLPNKRLTPDEIDRLVAAHPGLAGADYIIVYINPFGDGTVFLGGFRNGCFLGFARITLLDWTQTMGVPA